VQRHLNEPRAADGVLNHAEVASRIAADDDRNFAKRRVELDVIVGGVETWMVEDIEKLSRKFQGKPFCQLCVLVDRKVPSILKWPAENVASNGAEAGFRHIANCAVARRHTVGPRGEYGSRESSGIENRHSRIYARRPLQLCGVRILTGSKRDDRVGY